FQRDVGGNNPAGIYGVEQKLDAQSVPVKRVLQDGLRFGPGALSDRHSGRGFKARPMGQEGGTDPNSAAGAAPPPSGPQHNNLVRERYIDVTPQVRRMPVAMVVLIDETFMQDLLRQFANSPLRIQTTQMHWQHAEEGRRGGAPAGGAAAADQNPDEEEAA